MRKPERELGTVRIIRRTTRSPPVSKLGVVAVMTSPQYAMSPKQLVPKLADEGIYLASESTTWSRRIVGWRVHDRGSAGLAARMIGEICEDEAIDPNGLVLH